MDTSQRDSPGVPGAPTTSGSRLPSPLSIWVRWSGHDAAVFLRGDLDMATAEAAEARMNEVLTRRPSALVLDLGKVVFMDSAGVSLIVRVRQRLNSDIPVILRSPNRIVRKVLRIAGVDHMRGVQER